MLRASWWKGAVRIAAVSAAWLVAGVDAPIEAQVPNGFDPNWAGRATSPLTPPEGAWGEIINSTEKWLVLQNHAGQQFPIAVDDIDEFLIRWPSTVDSISPTGLVEAIGPSPGSNVVLVGHIDHFEGPDRTLVSPTYSEVLPNNMAVTTIDPGFSRFMNAWDYGGQQLLYGWAYPVPPGMQGNPARLHVVGGLIQEAPIRLGLPGNNFATVIPDDSGRITVTQITRGEGDMVRKGDYAYLMPIEAAPRGLRVSQLVIYKNVRLREFNANAGNGANNNR